MPETRLTGCASRPLLSYLKALGLLRVIAKQADANARGRWSQGVFEVRSGRGLDEIAEFLVEEYEPTPVVSPWNGGGGYYPHGNTTAVKNLTRVEGLEDPRLDAYREAIRVGRAVLEELGISSKPGKDEKPRLIRRLRRRWPDAALEWLDAAVVLIDDGVKALPILGPGGGDGRLDFSSNFMAAVGRMLQPGERSRASSLELARAALDGSPAVLRKDASAGHLFRDDSPNNTPNGRNASLLNPWDLILGVEGTLMLTAGAARRHGADVDASLVAPFSARVTAAGFASAAEENGRAEVWLPLWRGWAQVEEIEALVREGRAQVGRRRARTGLDFARAAASMGVARGVDAFERYAVLERSGQSNLAVPVGRIAVAPRPEADAVQAIDGWLQRMIRYRGTDHCPDAPRRKIRALESAVFELAAIGGPARAGAVVELFGAVEGQLARSARTSAEAGIWPLRGIGAEPWAACADDSSDEFAVALAIASLRDRNPVGPTIRDYLHGTVVRDGRRVFDADASTAVGGGVAARRIAAIHCRRDLDLHRGPSASGDADSDGDPSRARPPTGLRYDFGLPCEAASMRRFALGALDDERIVRLAGGLALLDFGGVRGQAAARSSPSAGEPPMPALDLLLLAWHGIRDVPLVPRHGWAQRLTAGTTAPVLHEAALRLRLAGLEPLVKPDDLGTARPDGARLCAALICTPTLADRRRIARRITAQNIEANRTPNDHEEAT